jgi:hypothetical protein
LSNWFNDKKKKAEAAIIAIVPIKKVKLTKSPAEGASEIIENKLVIVLLKLLFRLKY